MLPILLGIGAAALLLGRKVTRRVSRRNPSELKSYEFSFRKSPRDKQRVTWRRFGPHMEQALHLAKKAAKNDYPEACSFLIMRANPLRRGHSRAAISANIRRLVHEGRPRNQAVAIALRTAGVSRRNPMAFPAAAFAAELARQKAAGKGAPKGTGYAATATMPNPNEMISGPKRAGLKLMEWHGGQGSGLYALGSSWFSGKSVPADVLRSAWSELVRLNRQATVDPKSGGWSAKDVRELGSLVRLLNKKLARLKTNPPRRTGKRTVRRSRISVSQAAARMMQWRWHHNPGNRDLVPWIVVTTEARGFSGGKANIRTETSAFRGREHSAKALAAWVLRYNQSFTPSGVNHHVAKAFGYEPYAFKAKLINQRNGRVAATYDAPKFQAF
jgi:hypothetical protein